MKKFLLYFCLPLFVVAVGTLIFLQFFLGGLVRDQVNRRGPQITQARVELAGADLSPLTGHGKLTGLLVGNPKGWSEGNVLTLDKIEVDVDPKSIWGDHFVVNELIIEAPRFNYETKLVASNVGDLLKNIEKATAGGKDPTGKTEKGKPIKIEIKHLLIRNGSVTVGVGAGAATLPLPPVEMKNVGANGGITPGQLSVEILRSVTPTLVATTTAAVTKMIPGTAGETVKEAGQILKGLLGGEKK
jgi:hypothetical protein